MIAGPGTKQLSQRREQGFALMTAVITAGIITAMIAGFTWLHDSTLAARQLENLKKSRDSIYKNLVTALADPSVIQVSTLSNAMLATCVNPATISNCTALSSAAAVRFPLSMPMSSTTAAFQVSAANDTDLSGMYDRFGGHCSSMQNCAFIAKTYFWLSCPTTLANCAADGSVQVRVVVDGNPSWTGPGGSGWLGLSTKPLAPRSSDAASPAGISLRATIAVAATSCQSGAMMIGVDGNGNPICRCIVGSGAPIAGACPAVTCPSGALSGLTPVVNPTSPTSPTYTVVCKAPQACTDIATSNLSSDYLFAGGCPAGQYMKAFAVQSCYVDGVPTTKAERRAIVDGFNATNGTNCGYKAYACWVRFLPVRCDGGVLTCCPRQ